VTAPSAYRQPLSRRAKILIAVAGSIALIGIVATAVFNYLLADPRGTLVVDLVPGAGQQAREQLRGDCGGLPGIEAVADKGDPDPEVQGRFPVRFSIGSATGAQQTALETCVLRHEMVRGVRIEDR
jgi:hypothetical protein